MWDFLWTTLKILFYNFINSISIRIRFNRPHISKSCAKSSPPSTKACKYNGVDIYTIIFYIFDIHSNFCISQLITNFSDCFCHYIIIAIFVAIRPHILSICCWSSTEMPANDDCSPQHYCSKTSFQFHNTTSLSVCKYVSILNCLYYHIVYHNAIVSEKAGVFMLAI